MKVVKAGGDLLIDKSKLTQKLTEKMISAAIEKNSAEKASTEYIQAHERLTVLTEVINLVEDKGLQVEQIAPATAKEPDIDIQAFIEQIAEETALRIGYVTALSERAAIDKEIDTLTDNGQEAAALSLMFGGA